MIDNKKIEEAALGYCAKCSDITNRNVDLDEDECVDLYNGFIDGAKWSINELFKNLWHPASEEPEGYDEWILLHYSAFNYYSLSQVKYFKSWKEFVERAPIENWIYIDDLFQKEGGDHD